MSALNIAFIDFPFINLLIIAQIVSNIGSPKTINGNTITAIVYVFATPNIDIIDSEYPKKFEPVSPINVLAGVKLNGKNPTREPAKAAINIIDTSGEPLSTKIINNDTADITDIPADSPSKPSIKLIAFVIPTIQIIVIITDNVSLSSTSFRNGTSSILIPNSTATIAAAICPINFVIGFIGLISSTMHTIPIIIIPK